MKSFKVNGKIYSEDALKLAAFICGEEKIVKIVKKKEYFEVFIGAEDADVFFKEFLNEALNHQCRIDLAAINSRIANIIATKTLLSAMGEK